MTITEHYNRIIQIKEGKSELSELKPYNENGANLMSELNSGSKVAIWRLWCWIMAVLAWMLEISFIKHKDEVNQLIASQRHGTLRSYQTAALNFQFGHALFWNGKQYVYPLENQESKIIKRCTVGMHQGVLRFKVTKENTGVLEPLTPAEYDAFRRYILDIVHPGTNFAVTSSAADLLKLIAKIYVDPQILDLTGHHVSNGKPMVENAINEFIKNLPFNGRMNIQKLIDEIQAVDGVLDVRLLEAAYKYGSLSWITFDREIEPFSGYMALDLLSSNIEYHNYV